MRILLLSDTPIKEEKKGMAYNGRGWLSSQLKIMGNIPDVTIGICYNSQNDNEPFICDSLSFYPIQKQYQTQNKLRNLICRWLDCFDSRNDIEKVLNVINSFQPDIIHLFGSEWYGIQLLKRTETPILLHIQGLTSASVDLYYPPGYNRFSFFKSFFKVPFKFAKGISFFHLVNWMKSSAKNELEYLPYLKHACGRTDWDSTITRFYAPKLKYYHLNEVLRDCFYEAPKWKYDVKERMIFISVISDSPYKGLQMIFQTISKLQKFSDINFVWQIVGVDKDSESARLFKDKIQPACVEFLGVQDPERMIDFLLDATLYVHPSATDNSSNSVCEAQYLGVPVVMTNVGGASTLTENGNAGILVPSYDSTFLAASITKVAGDTEFLQSLSIKEIELAERRHDRDRIKNNLIGIYNNILNE
ncbi:MAG: glycosyltransferase [Bacteroidales bacterium]